MPAKSPLPRPWWTGFPAGRPDRRIAAPPAAGCGWGGLTCRRSAKSAPAHPTPPSRAGTGNAPRFPRLRGTSPRGPRHERPAPGPAGGKRPPGAGRAQAGGFGPPAGQGSAGRCGRGDGPCQRHRAFRHGQGHRLSGREQETHAFPPPARNAAPKTGATGTNRGQRPTRRARSARRVRGGRWPGALAPGGPRVSVATWQGRWPLPWQRGGRFGF
jgi:hypothetical protein